MATIDELSAALVKADAAGNTADAKAFADEIRRLRGTETPAGTRANVQAEPAPRWTDYATSALEIPVTLGTGLVASAVAPALGVARQLVSGKQPFGTYEAGAEAEKYAQDIAKAMTYTPRTVPGQKGVAAIGEAVQQSGLASLPPVIAPELGVLAAPATQQAIQAAKQEGALISQAARNIPAVKARRETAQAARMQQSYERAPQIEAAQEANQLGINLNPAESNPTPANRLRVAMAGESNVDYRVAKSNEQQWNRIAKDELGLPQTATLNADAFEQARSRPEIAGPYNQVRSVGRMTADNDVMQAIDSLRSQALIGGESAATKVDSLVDSALNQISSGLTGQQTLDNIRNLRRNANNIYTAQKKGMAPSQEQLTVADAQLGIANALENLVEANIKDPTALGNFRQAREAMARTYDYERATNLATGQLDPTEVAKMVKEGKPLSGNLAAIGRIAANYPSAAEIGATQPSAWQSAIKRTGAMGTLGAGIGLMTGIPGASLAGGTIGGTAGLVGGRLLSRNITSPELQARIAVPTDYRLPVNELAPGRAPIVENALAPYDWQQAINQGPYTTYTPNWVFGQREGVAPNVQPGVAGGVPLLPSDTPEVVMGRVLNARQFEYGAEKRAAERAAAAAEAAAQAGRQPTSGGVLYELDPTTGRLQPVSRGLPGATPETISSTGHDLASATEKIAAGQKFNMTAAEKIAWDKARIDLAEVAPEFNKLSEKAIFERMQDRDWVADAAKKAREKAAGFEQLANRAKDDAARREAAINRERMLDLAETMEEQLRAPRPIASASQGPKTREAIRNRLAPENQNQLAR